MHTYAQAAISHGRILIRFAHVMDGRWFVYGFPRCRNTPATFRAMWKNVVSIFGADAATNV